MIGRVSYINLLLLAVALLECGCTSPAKPPPGRSAVAVLVRAEPKAGWKDPAQHGSAYDPVQIGGSRSFKAINYSNLDEIVVWIELTADNAENASPPQAVTVDVGSGVLYACGSADMLNIRNPGTQPLATFVRYESGRLVDLGALAPGEQRPHRPLETGYIEIACEPNPDDAAARVFVAGIPTASHGRLKVATSGSTTVFNDLPSGGTARVTCWHPRLPGSTADVSLVPGVTSNVTLIVGVNQLPKVPK